MGTDNKSSNTQSAVISGKIKDFFGKDGKAIIACSGGVDSMLLTYLTVSVLGPENCVVCHFNHMTRGHENLEESNMVNDFCAKLGVRLEIGSADIPKLSEERKVGLEETARNERYSFMQNIYNDVASKSYGKVALMTGHHTGDLTETMILNLIKGCKIPGLVALSETGKTYGGMYVFRPFLKTVGKDQIRTLAKSLSVPHMEDSSNLDTKYQRNLLRNVVVPELKTINPGLENSFVKLYSYAEETKAFIDFEIQKFVNTHCEIGNGLIKTDPEQFKSLNPFLQKEMLRYLFSNANGGTVGLSEGNIAELLDFTVNGGWGRKMEIKNFGVVKTGKAVYFGEKDQLPKIKSFRGRLGKTTW